MSIQKGIETYTEDKHETQSKKWFQKLIQEKQYVGELYSINYETAKVIIHDYHRKEVGGIPSLSFLIATRINPFVDETINFTKEDSSIILLRVMDATLLPQDKDNERVKTETAQRLLGEKENWGIDLDKTIDTNTRQTLLAVAGVQCRIIGTFYLDLSNENQQDSDLGLKFGCDISNYYPNRGLKVYKPNAEALKEIVNFIDNSVLADYRERFNSATRVNLGSIRYASTNRKYQQVDDVPVSIFPADLLSQKSALFGMTRTGKSNTAKIIAKSVYELRYPKSTDDRPLRIGQIIFDPNGEYANENAQDKDKNNNPNALKNIWTINPKVKRDDEVVTYGLETHPNDPERRLMKINFYDEKTLQTGKDIINSQLADETAQYFRNFCQVRFQLPNKDDYPKTKDGESEFWRELYRYTRRKLVYQTLLKKAGFEPTYRNAKLKLGTKPLFPKDFRDAMSLATDRDGRKQGLMQNAATVFANDETSWDNLIPAFEGLFYFLSNDAYINFNNNYIASHNGETWAESDLERLLEMFLYTKGSNLIGELTVQHTKSVDEDYAELIYKDLKAGKLVIIDQSSGIYEVNKSTAERIVQKIFDKNQSLFRKGEPTIPEILIYVEEAHNILPSDKEGNMRDIWVRTAKEGAKYRIGMVYSTQEVSSIQRNILKNTANWFIGHLNNSDETKELTKFYDFGDFENSILRTQDKGFLRVKTLSNYFVIPVQVKRFDVTDKS